MLNDNVKRHGGVVVTSDRPTIVNKEVNCNNSNSSCLICIRRREFCQMNTNSAKFPRILKFQYRYIVFTEPVLRGADVLDDSSFM